MLHVSTGATLTAALYAAFLVWRHATYGEWLPNTYFAKLDGGPDLITNIKAYVVASVFPYGHSLVFALMPAALALLPAHRRLAVLLAVLAPDDLMRRFAWLREQSIPRLSHAQLLRNRNSLVAADVAHKKRVATYARRLIWDARLASLTDEVPSAVRSAEQQVIEAYIASHRCEVEPAGARRALCLGRAVDTLRRFGYFGVLKRIPSVRAELEAIHARRGTLDTADRYVAAVGLFLAMPDRIDMNKELSGMRSAFARTNAFPALDIR